LDIRVSCSPSPPTPLPRGERGAQEPTSHRLPFSPRGRRWLARRARRMRGAMLPRGRAGASPSPSASGRGDKARGIDRLLSRHGVGGSGLSVRCLPLTPVPSPTRGEGGAGADKPQAPLLPSWEKVARPQGETDEGAPRPQYLLNPGVAPLTPPAPSANRSTAG